MFCFQYQEIIIKMIMKFWVHINTYRWILINASRITARKTRTGWKRFRKFLWTFRMREIRANQKKTPDEWGKSLRKSPCPSGTEIQPRTGNLSPRKMRIARICLASHQRWPSPLCISQIPEVVLLSISKPNLDWNDWSMNIWQAYLSGWLLIYKKTTCNCS